MSTNNSTKNPYLIPYILITSLFFLWGLASNLNPILIPSLKIACQLTDMQSAFIDSAFYIGYFLMAIPSGTFMKRSGYKSTIIVGLLLFALGAFLFYPAAETRTYALFLLALFIIASGATFLETAANPYTTILGPPETATQRINFSQSFNGLAATLAPFLGGLFIFSGKELSKTEMDALPSDELLVYLTDKAKLVQTPYVIIGIIVLLVALFFWKTKLPEIKEDNTNTNEKNVTFKDLFVEKNLLLGALAQFFYVGAQACVGGFFIRLAEFTSGIEKKEASYYLSVALLLFMIGRFLGTFLMKYIAPYRLLFIYSICCMALIGLTMVLNGMPVIYCVIGVNFFMSIMFPTIFSLSTAGLGSKTKLGSSLVVMGVGGGAFFPVIMGAVSDSTKNIQISYIVPLLCLILVAIFALRTTTKEATLTNNSNSH
jgi:MFS transporter, FHS family, L-fucose permease